MADPTQQSPVRGTVDVRLKIAALWTAVMFVFAYVDLFSLYRPDVRAGLEAGKVFVFDVGQTFLFFTTLYVILPSLMIYLSLVLPRRVNQPLNVALAAVYAVTIAGSAVGEWAYFVLGSAVEAVLLGALVYHAWTWRETST
jgi:hypothetical protein